MSLRDIFDNNSKKRPALQSVTDALVDEYISNEEEQNPQEEMCQSDPLINSVGGGDDSSIEQTSEKFLNRMIRIQGLKPRDKNNPKAGIFDDPELLEQIILSSHDKTSAKRTWRRYIDNRDTREGDGNRCLADARDKSLLLRILLTRSLTDTEICANERALWTIRENRSKQTNTTMNVQPRGAPGFLSRIFGK
jgi:hypothetical protein